MAARDHAKAALESYSGDPVQFWLLRNTVVAACEAAAAEEKEHCARLVDELELKAKTLGTLRFMVQISEAAGPPVRDVVRAAYDAIAAEMNGLASKIRAREA